MQVFVFERVKNILGKGEMLVNTNFSFSNNAFKKKTFNPPPQKKKKKQ